MAKKNKGGRPTVMTEGVLQKLEYGFMKGLSDSQCCAYADIAPSTLYNYCDSHPEFLERKEQLKNSPSVKAKLNIVEAIEEGDYELSKWWLERKEKQEFSTKQEIDANVDADVTINIELSDDE